jgi:twitching motility two-component system response regulator PilG
MREDSIPALIEGMIQLALLRPGEVEEALWSMMMTDFDNYLYTLAGTCRFEIHDILARERPINGFELDTVLHHAAQRQDKWSDLKITIPTMLAVPVVNWERIESSNMTEEQRQRLHTLTKDRLPLESIASKLCRDRLDIAQTFAGWIRKGFITLQIPQELKQVQHKTGVKTILAVDDSIVMQEVVRQTLSTYRVITTGNPSEVLNLIFQYQPDLVIMDVCMPGIDGIELCRIIRSLEEFKSIPVIMLTARDGLLDRVRGALSGATRYMTKPIDELKLNLEVERLLSNRAKPLRPLASKPEVNPEWQAYNASSGL